MTGGTEDIAGAWAHARALARGRGERLSSTHVLAALAEGGGPAQGLLGSHGVDGTWVRLRTTGAAEPPSVLEQADAAATRLARSLHARSTGAVHLLAALLRMPETSAFGVLRAGGIEVDKLSAAVHGFLSGAARWRSRAREPGAAPPGPSRPARAPTVPFAASRRRPAEPAADPSRGLSPAGARPQPPHPEGCGSVPDAAVQPASRPEGDAVPAAARRVVPSPSARIAPRPSAAAPSRPHPAATSPARAAAPRAVKAAAPKARPRLGPWLAAHARDLRQAAADGALDPAVARDDLVERLLDVLQKRRASSPCLVGPGGVGKSALVAALAQRLAAERDDATALFAVTAAACCGGADGAARVRQLATEAAALGRRVVLAVGDLPQLARALAEAGEGAEAALREALEARAFALLVEADAAAWERALRATPALARCLTPVEVSEPDEAAAQRMIAAVAPRYGAHHGVAVEDAAVEAAVRIARRYVVGRALPDKAVQLLDLAAARAQRAGRTSAGAAQVADVAAEQIDVPADRLLATDGERFLRLEGELERRIVGHRETLARIADVLRRNAAGFRDRRPIGSFLFLGPTGVGKTETARAMAECLFPGRENLLRLDMSEYAEAHAVARLVGAPPGYVGHESGGLLGDALRRRPYQVVLLDEFEKAHPDVHRLFLQVLEEGRLTDGRGQAVEFRNAVVVMTSNLGSELFAERKAVGFGRAEDAPEGGRVLAAARRALPPELWNRIDEPLVFGPLGRDELRRIARMLLDATCAAATAGRELALAADDEVIEHLLAAGGWEPALGARPMRRAIQRLVEAPLARALLDPALPSGARLRVVVRGGAVEVLRDTPVEAEAACA